MRLLTSLFSKKQPLTLLAAVMIAALIGCDSPTAKPSNTIRLLAGKIALNNDGKPITPWASSDFKSAISETAHLAGHAVAVYRENPNNPEKFSGDPVLVATSEAEQTFLIQSNNDERYTPCLDALRDKEGVRGLVERGGPGYPIGMQNYLARMVSHAESCQKVGL
ncbi:MAG: hypothetical protein AB1400_05835 [Pseudomonadota bacterium]